MGGGPASTYYCVYKRVRSKDRYTFRMLRHTYQHATNIDRVRSGIWPRRQRRQTRRVSCVGTQMAFRDSELESRDFGYVVVLVYQYHRV